MSSACLPATTRCFSTFQVRSHSMPERGSPADVFAGLCNAGASTLHNSLGGAGCGGNNCEDMVSTVPAWTGTANENACQGKMLNDPCMPSMGALAPPLPEGAARLTVHLRRHEVLNGLGWNEGASHFLRSKVRKNELGKTVLSCLQFQRALAFPRGFSFYLSATTARPQV